MESSELQDALEVIESTNLKYFTKDMIAEFLALKGSFLTIIGRYSCTYIHVHVYTYMVYITTRITCFLILRRFFFWNCKVIANYEGFFGGQKCKLHIQSTSSSSRWAGCGPDALFKHAFWTVMTILQHTYVSCAFKTHPMILCVLCHSSKNKNVYWWSPQLNWVLDVCLFVCLFVCLQVRGS